LISAELVRTLFGFALLAVQLGLAIPIAIQLLRSRDRQGFSLTGEMIWIAIGAGWVVYGALTGSILFTLSGLLAGLTSLLVTVLIWRSHGKTQLRATLAAVAVAILIAAGLVIAGVPGTSFMLSALGVVQFVPQIVESMRQLRAGRPIPGVSAGGATARGCYTLGWAIYGLGYLVWGADAGGLNWPLITWGFAGTLAFGLLALAARRTRG